MVQGKSTIQNKEPGNVIRGYKATTSNPRVSEEAKENARQKIEELKNQGESQEQTQAEARSARYADNQRINAEDTRRNDHANVDAMGEDEEEEPEFMPGEEQEVREEEEADREIEEEGEE